MTSDPEGWGLEDFKLLRYSDPYVLHRHYQGVALSEWHYYPAPGDVTLYQVHRVNLTTLDMFTDRSAALTAAEVLYNADKYTSYPPYKPTGDGDQLLT